ncbi:OmpA family protein [Marinomonas ostreistagni]|uniref:OmpA family protein n=1 Tax=Marinomonas ostreistagni TaxID=359209 RepID=UPI00194F3A40|nr:OmpA family protein [Marinomonas ostreistagni]MBM6550342.1 OmpA family protein [Marinomonas ostreistagni]
MPLFPLKASAFALAAMVASSTLYADELYQNKDSIQDKIGDQDQDGVVNVRDFCPNTTLGAAVDNDGCSRQDNVLMSAKLEIYFDVNQTDVKPIYYSEVKKIADFLKQNPGSNAVIEGHTDNQGKSTYNLNLSQGRADAVALVLTQQFGIDPSRIESVGYGEAQPIAPNETANGREQNRRVVADIFAQTVEEQQRWDIYSAE